MILLLFGFLLASAVCLHAQPPMGGGPGGGCSANANLGQVSATGCVIESGSSCGTSYSTSNHIEYTGSPFLPSLEGRYSVVFKTNSCPNNAKTNFNDDSRVTYSSSSTACCTIVSLPVAAYTGTSAKAAPLRGTVGYTLFGVQLYGPFEAGFSLGMACSNNKGTCTAGLDVPTCKAKLEADCGTDKLLHNMLLDTCGGHANPYHFHTGMRCEYNVTNQSIGHSPLIGFGLDGVGLFGKFESNFSPPTDLDACGGHVGPTPDTIHSFGTFLGSSSSYHYHVGLENGTSLLNCFGPVSSQAAVKALYPRTCDTGFETICTSKGMVTYDLDCPGFQPQFTPTPTCPVCIGNCSSAMVSPNYSPRRDHVNALVAWCAFMASCLVL